MSDMDNGLNLQGQPQTLLDRLVMFSLKNKLVVTLLVLLFVAWGIMVAPFDWKPGFIPRDPIPVDAIPDIGENQQIVFSKWMGRSPQDVEDQVTYPLTASLLGVPSVKTIRSISMFGFSTIYVIFKEEVDFYWSRSRILERLNSLPAETLPPGVQPVLGPDATALGQVYWYTLEGRDEKGNPNGGWDLQELRTIQDFYVRYALLSADGISEVASVGGFVREYQVDVDPDAMRAYGVTLEQVFSAVKMSNLDVGARTIEINQVEYVIRGIGFIKNIEDIENSVINVSNHVPVYVKNVARVVYGPALRRGALDREGIEAVGGVAVVRFGGNPLAAIDNLKKKIAEISPGLPQKKLADGSISKVTIVPFYDRTGLIHETLQTLNEALFEEILVTIIVVILLLLNLRSSLLIAGLLPLAVLMSFIAMKQFGVDANIVALSGIAIAIGTMVDMGIVIVENIVNHLEKEKPSTHQARTAVVARAVSEVGSAVITAVSTTVISFLPVFSMEGAEGKLFKPLAFTKTFALVASILVAIIIIPPYAQVLFTSRIKKGKVKIFFNILLLVAGIAIFIFLSWWLGMVLILVGIYRFLENKIPRQVKDWLSRSLDFLVVIIVAILLASHWLPLGPEKGLLLNLFFVSLLIGGLLLFFYLFQGYYGRILRRLLVHKTIFLTSVVIIVLLGGLIWSNLGREFMPPLDEGAFLYMPTTMPHASIGEALDVLKKQDIAFARIPEIETAVGKIGRADTPLDPAPISMIETVINYKPKFLADGQGKRLRFRYEPDETDYFRSVSGEPLAAGDGQPYLVKGKFIRDENNQLIPDAHGQPFLLWRPPLDVRLNEGRRAWPGIRSPDDIWYTIAHAGQVPGTTSAPQLQPIAARLVMLQSGMRAPMGIKVKGPSLAAIEAFGLRLEQLLKEVPGVEPTAVFADRIIGKPYLEIDIDRSAIARYGIHLQKMQEVIEVALGGKNITMTVEGRERYPVRVRYLRELRDEPEALERVLVSAADGTQIPLVQLATVKYVRGPQMIKSEDTFLVGYVLFDKLPNYAEVDVVEAARAYLEEKTRKGELEIPAGISYTFSGSYENQVRSAKKLALILPLALFVIFLVLYFQFRRVSTTLLVFSDILVSWSGGFILIWLYGQSWFLDFPVFGVNMQELFQVHPVNLSVAVWVGFLALFGIATDDGVLMVTYLDQVFARTPPSTIQEIREATIEAAQRRIRPALMTSATTILALLPVLTSTGRGSDIMVPMAIPSFGGMSVALVTLFVIPVIYCRMKERAARAPRS